MTCEWDRATVEVDRLGPARAQRYAGQVVIDGVVMTEVVRATPDGARRAGERLLAVLRGDEPAKRHHWYQAVSASLRQCRIF